jgi:hypothetical protein
LRRSSIGGGQGRWGTEENPRPPRSVLGHAVCRRAQTALAGPSAAPRTELQEQPLHLHGGKPKPNDTPGAGRDTSRSVHDPW